MFNTPLPTVNELPSTRKLVRSTVIAILVAAGLLLTVVMPSEYAIDPTGVGRTLGLTQMGELKIILAQEALADAAPPATTSAAPAPQVAQAQPIAKPAPQPEVSSAPALKKNQITVTLKPGEGKEIKLEMLKGKTVRYEWTAAGGPVNYETHGEPYNGEKGYFHSYGKGKQVKENQGEFTAIFDGTHGWFWRNRSNSDVTLSLKTSGDYLSIKQ
ncbi:transmembrane anchor protein [Pseudomonas viridiflava]|uniref:Transmembrane anchor protein n=1 Tax=Pseudomonas viridiflava TaxID=33069 RepID=A0ABU7N723_PSEVI|nr:transmembrane anchor protein [Pseudomonas viridiflava]MBI6574099.1 transmembrane anchor protein [Pseudomonas viridiflava]MBI6606069.1 transmembrane anchor protein [Pseudomonas viridiflava]MBI6640379.1 transmembrane anchor protein [Pseudomonas viridiflava]MBI6867673.1 transmembrane anchor protein [Pseudomonas viridiflava]MEE3936816.1 transmembrane anchor protein [Pseudomonas viridiflava]